MIDITNSKRPGPGPQQQQQQKEEKDFHQQLNETSPSTAPAHSFDNDNENNETQTPPLYIYSPESLTGRILIKITQTFRLESTRSGSALPGFLSLLLLTMANYMLSPMRDAAALAVGVSYIPLLTLASTILALASSVPMGWLFEAPNPMRSGRGWRGRVGLTRGETQGTSLALFLRCFAVCLLGYAITFKVLEWLDWDDLASPSSRSSSGSTSDTYDGDGDNINLANLIMWLEGESILVYAMRIISTLLRKSGKFFYVAFFLVVHLMKLHSLSLIWGVTSEALEYEEQAEIRERRNFKKKMELQRQEQRGRSATPDYQHHQESKDDGQNNSLGKSSGKRSRIRLKRLAFVGFGGTLGGILGSVFVSMTAHKLRLSGLLIVAAILLLLSAELSVELGQIMFRYWEEEQLERCSDDDLVSLGVGLVGSGSGTTMGETVSTNGSSVTATLSDHNVEEIDSSLKRVSSVTGMKRTASGVSMTSMNSMSNLAGVDTSMKRIASIGSMKRVASGNSIAGIRRAMSSQNSLSGMAGAGSNNNVSTEGKKQVVVQNVHISVTSAQRQQQQYTNEKDIQQEEQIAPDSTFKQRLLRGVITILRSRLLMTIFTYNALYATTSTLLSFQRAELVANRSSASNNNSMDSDTAFLARINIVSSVAVFVLQASGLGAIVANGLGQRGALALMPIVRMLGVAILALWHVKTTGAPPNLTLFLILDEFTKVINFAIAKPVRESLWRGLSNEARYEAKPIVDTLANRWGGGSAAFLMSLLDRIMLFTGVGRELRDGTKSLFGFPPLLILCAISAAWWAFVSADLGNIRHRIDLELKKQQ